MTTPPIYRPNLPTGTAPGTAAEFRQIGEVSRRQRDATDALEGRVTTAEGELPNKVSKAGDTMTGALRLPFGTGAAPSLTFDGDENTGVLRSAADQLGLSAGGATRVFVNADSVQFGVPLRPSPGTAVAPAYQFDGATNSGLFSPAANQVALSTNGVSRLSVTTTGIVAALPVTLPAANPTAANMAARKAYVDAGDRWVTIADAAITTVSVIDVTWATGAYRAVEFILSGFLPTSFGVLVNLYLRFRLDGVWQAGGVYGTNGAEYQGAVGTIMNLGGESVVRLTTGGTNTAADGGFVRGLVSAGGAGIEPSTLHTSKWSSPTGRSFLTAGGSCSVNGNVDGLRFFWHDYIKFAAVGRIIVLGLKA